MAMMRTANPALSDKTFSGLGPIARTEERMSIQGTTNKSLLLLLCVCLTAAWTWSTFFKSGHPQAMMPLVVVGAIAGFVLALITIFKPVWAGVTGPLYALAEGLVIGGISSIAEAQFPGIVIQAVGLTFGTCLALLLAYKSGLIRATEGFKGYGGGHRRHRLFYLVSIVWGCSGCGSPGLRVRPGEHRHQPDRSHRRRLEPGAGLRFHRAGGRPGGTQIHGVVRGLRPDGHPHLALHRNP